MLLTRRLRGLWSRNEAAGGRLQDALHAARGQARALAGQIGGDAAAIDLAATEAAREGASLTRGVDETVRSCDWTEGAVNRALQGVTGLTDAVRTTTANIRRMEELATRLSQDAHGTQTVFAGLEDRLGRLDAAFAQIDRAARSAGALISASVAAAQAGIQGADSASVGQEVLGFVGVDQQHTRRNPGGAAGHHHRDRPGDTPGERDRRAGSIPTRGRHGHEPGSGPARRGNRSHPEGHL